MTYIIDDEGNEQFTLLLGTVERGTLCAVSSFK